MRLINAQTLQVEEFVEHRIPRYAILSHTWEEDEVLFHELRRLTDKLKLKPSEARITTAKRGFKKIKAACKQAIAHGLDYAWVDTACIDKTSSAELSEAINSMFKWYKNSVICYAYLSDVHDSSTVQFTQSRWFTRGWTLQELLAPEAVDFYGADWQCLGSRHSLRSEISKITGIDVGYLGHQERPQRPISAASIAQRLSWASSRETTRTEDCAYSLLGIFDIQMPLLYGEGPAAFTRLQAEIIRVSNDQSLFVWRPSRFDEGRIPIRNNMSDLTHIDYGVPGLFAEGPRDYKGAGQIVPDELQAWPSFEITNKGVRVELPLLPLSGGTWSYSWAIFACRREDSLSHVLAMPVCLVEYDTYLAFASSTCLLPRKLVMQARTRSIYLKTNRTSETRLISTSTRRTHASNIVHIRYLHQDVILDRVEPIDIYDENAMMIKQHEPTTSLSVRLYISEARMYGTDYIKPHRVLTLDFEFGSCRLEAIPYSAPDANSQPVSSIRRKHTLRRHALRSFGHSVTCDRFRYSVSTPKPVNIKGFQQAFEVWSLDIDRLSATESPTRTSH